MKAMRWGVCILWVIFGFARSGVADEPALFRFSRPVVMGKVTQEELFSVPLDRDIYAATRDNFPDLRVLNSDDQLIPFLIRHVRESRTDKVAKSWTATNPGLRPLETDGLEIRVTLTKDDPAPMGIRFLTPLKDFEQHVRIFATADGRESTLVDEALIFDYSKFMDVRRTVVAIPPTTAREFRIVIDALTADQESQLLEFTRSLRNEAEVSRSEKITIQRRPFRIDRLEFWTEQTEQTQQADVVLPWAVTDFTVTHDSKLKQTLVTFDTHRQPVTAVKVVSSSRNFSRQATVQVETFSGAESSWSTIAEATISHFQLRDFQDEHMTIGLPETRAGKFRLVLENRDNPALTMDSVEIAGHQHEVVFVGTPGKSVRLEYGSESTQKPELDTVALKTALAKDITPIAATLGIQTVNLASAAPQPLDAKRLLNNPLIVGAVIGVLVIVLGWGLFQASRKIDQMPRSDDE
jgi:hypothetical protein